ncbi:30S ribosomal protein S16 [Patescibacteria group bacterium]|nr:30S ribosomal protein S16 [Patescibacteria group bacterium]
MIRLQRVGRKNDPNFRVIVTDKRKAARAGRYVEMVGSYNPRQKKLQLNEERIRHWLSVGAQPSGTVHNFLVSKNIIQGPKMNVSPSSKIKKPASTLPDDSVGKVGVSTPPEADEGKKAEAEEKPTEEPKAE